MSYFKLVDLFLGKNK